MEIMRYRTANAQRQRKLRQFTQLSDPEDLRGELAAARLLAQESLEAGNIGTANHMLTTVGKLVQGQLAAKRMRGEFLERAAVRQLVTRLVEILAKAVEGRFDGWEDVLSNVADEAMAEVATAKNENPRELEAAQK